MSIGDITNIGTPLTGNTGTSQVFPVTTAPTAPSNAGIIVTCSCGDNGNVNDAACTDSRGNTYTRTRQQNASGLTEFNVFHCIGATALQDGDSITISGISDARVRAITACYVEGMGTLFGSSSATGTSTTPSSGNVTNMPDGSIAIGLLGWSNQVLTGVFSVATQDADYSSDFTGANSNLGGAAGSDRAVFAGNRVISGVTTDNYAPTLDGSSVWNAILLVFDPATGVAIVSPTQGYTIDAPGLTQVHNLAIVSATAGFTATTPNVQPDTGDIVAVSAECGHEATSPSIAQDGDIVIVSATFGHTVTSPRLLIIDDDFERSSVNVSGSSVTGSDDSATITLKPRVQESEAWPPSGGTRWLFPYARVTGVSGIRPTFALTDYAATPANGTYHGAPWPSGRRMMFSYDPDDPTAWVHFDTAHTVGASTITFRHSTAFTQGTVYIAWSRAKSVTQIGNWIDDLATTYPAIVTTLPSTLGSGSVPAAIQSFPAQDYISAMFSAQADELGRTIPETPFYGFGLNDTSLTPTDGSNKRLCVLHSGVHAGEDLGEFVLERAIAFLLGADSQAVNLRRHFYFYVYPMHNAPGRYGGGHRGSFTQGSSGEDDANRHYSETDTTLEIIDIPKAVFVADWPARVDVNLSFHGNFAFQRELYTPDQSGDDYYDAVDVYENGINDNTATVTGSYGFWVRNTFDTYLATTIETGEPTPLTEAALTQWSESLMKAVDDLFEAGSIPSTISPQASTAGHTVSAPSLEQESDELPIVSVTTGHTATSPTLTQTTTLIVVSAIRGHEATTPSTSTLVGTISIVSCTMGHTVTAPEITTFSLGTTPEERTFHVANENRNLQIAASARELVA